MREQELICIGCPLGCHVRLEITDEDEVKDLSGNKCKEGKEYVVAEYRAPVRVFTATVLSEEGGHPLPVRTNKPVHKAQLKELARVISKVRVKAPIKIGDVIVPNFLGTGADLIASGTL